MLQKKREHPLEKVQLHPNNKHRARYNFKELIASLPALAPFVHINPYKDESIDFFNPEAVKMLNKALLKHFYDINYWDIPQGYLCPPIPGRADYIHHIASLLGSKNNGNIPTGNKIKCLDIGVGANCVYPIIGTKEYAWSFVGTDIDAASIENAGQIIEQNACLKNNVELKLHKKSNGFFNGVINEKELFDLVICNPPYHSSLEEAQAGMQRKLNNLHQQRVAKPISNFGGKNSELWCKGGEERFVRDLIFQSEHVANYCFWFSSVISKHEHLKNIYEALSNVPVFEYKTIEMSQGNKTSRIVAWTYLTPEQQEKWIETRWK